ADVQVPHLEVLEVNKLLDVSGFTKLLASNTEATRPIFLRKHLLDVHKVAVDVLSATVEKDTKRLVSLVGCPGTGKTWRGWLVAHALQKAGKCTLHVTIRGNEVIAVPELKKKKSYEIADWNYFMLKQVLTKNHCDVCIIDVGNKTPAESNYIFQGVRAILESSAEPKPFPEVKLMGLVSGHGEETIVGKDGLDECTQRLVLWSWSEQEFNAYYEAVKKDGKAEPLREKAYGTCGGSVRYWFKTERDQAKMDRDVEQLSPQDTQRFLTPDHRPTSNANHHEHSRLLAFFRKPKLPEDDFKRGVVSAYIVPRSEYVICSIRAHKKGSFSQFKSMYEVLLPLNPGAAGTPFEILVHYFWEERVNEKGNTTLQMTDQH
ncbi:Klp61F, partial [Symbiodinium pilosum]